MTESICSKLRKDAPEKKVNNFKLDLSKVNSETASRNPIYELTRIK